MQFDKFGAAHSTTSGAAIKAFETAVQAVAAHRPIGDSLQSALRHDDNMVAAHALFGFANVILGRSETVANARGILAGAETRMHAVGGGTASERALVAALRLAIDDHLQAAADLLDLHLIDQPCDFLAVKLSHALRFMGGQSAEMLRVTQRILPSWTSGQAGYGFLLGCHAFSLEETGHFVAAESFGRDAYAHENADAWGLHAVSHVMEMSRRTDEGADWLEDARPNWSLCNNFAFHIGWHLALFRLEQGRIDSVLDIYDRDIRPVATDDFRDMANATSMLWRLELEGISVGSRWDELRAVASNRRRDVTYVFGSLHYLLALAASGDRDRCLELLNELRKIAATPNHDQAIVAAEVGVPLAEVIIAMSQGSSVRSDLVAAAHKLPIIGGSHAQRDVFLRTLMMAAAEQGNSSSVLAITRIRHSLRSTDRFVHLIEKRLNTRIGASNATLTAQRAS